MEDPVVQPDSYQRRDIHATEGNRNGFAKDEFVPYLVSRLILIVAGG